MSILGTLRNRFNRGKELLIISNEGEMQSQLSSTRRLGMHYQIYIRRGKISGSKDPSRYG